MQDAPNKQHESAERKQDAAPADPNAAKKEQVKEKFGDKKIERTNKEQKEIGSILSEWEDDLSIKPGEARYEKLVKHINRQLVDPINSKDHSIEVRYTKDGYSLLIQKRRVSPLENKNQAEVSIDKKGKLTSSLEMMNTDKAKRLFDAEKYEDLLDYLDNIIDSDKGFALDANALNIYAYTLTKMPNITREQKMKALRLSEMALKKSPDDYGFMDTRACALAENGKFEEAFALWKKAGSDLKQKINRLQNTAPNQAKQLQETFDEMGVNYRRYKNINEKNKE